MIDLEEILKEKWKGIESKKEQILDLFEVAKEYLDHEDKEAIEEAIYDLALEALEQEVEEREDLEDLSEEDLKEKLSKIADEIIANMDHMEVLKRADERRGVGKSYHVDAIYSRVRYTYGDGSIGSISLANYIGFMESLRKWVKENILDFAPKPEDSLDFIEQLGVYSMSKRYTQLFLLDNVDGRLYEILKEVYGEGKCPYEVYKKVKNEFIETLCEKIEEYAMEATPWEVEGVFSDDTDTSIVCEITNESLDFELVLADEEGAYEAMVEWTIKMGIDNIKELEAYLYWHDGDEIADIAAEYCEYIVDEEDEKYAEELRKKAEEFLDEVERDIVERLKEEVKLKSQKAPRR